MKTKVVLSITLVGLLIGALSYWPIPYDDMNLLEIKMIKTLLFGLSSVLGQQLIETDSTEFVGAVHQRLLERRDFYLEGGIMMLHEALISIENSELSSYKLEKNITEVPSSYTR